MPRTPRRPRAARPRRRARAVTIVAVVAAAVAIGAIVWGAVGASGPRAYAVIGDSRAATAAETSRSGTPEHAAAAYLAEQATAVWLVPERDPASSIRERIDALAREARAQRATLTLVVYGLPERDCGNFSAGGLDPAAYDEWTAAIGDALRAAGVDTVLALEPDSIALSPECGDPRERARQLQTAVENLTGDEVDIYIDGGHSTWHSPDLMAELIRSMSVIDDVRGFTSNISNYNDDETERAYVHELSALLGGAHAIVDTSRNGAGGTGEWCNPPDRLIGAPGGTYDDDVIDANLWIKAPGESDGTCQGGPPAGEWWPESAVTLTREALG